MDTIWVWTDVTKLQLDKSVEGFNHEVVIVVQKTIKWQIEYTPTESGYLSANSEKLKQTHCSLSDFHPGETLMTNFPRGNKKLMEVLVI